MVSFLVVSLIGLVTVGHAEVLGDSSTTSCDAVWLLFSTVSFLMELLRDSLALASFDDNLRYS